MWSRAQRWNDCDPCVVTKHRIGQGQNGGCSPTQVLGEEERPAGSWVAEAGPGPPGAGPRLQPPAWNWGPFRPRTPQADRTRAPTAGHPCRPPQAPPSAPGLALARCLHSQQEGARQGSTRPPRRSRSSQGAPPRSCQAPLRRLLPAPNPRREGLRKGAPPPIPVLRAPGGAPARGAQVARRPRSCPWKRSRTRPWGAGAETAKPAGPRGPAWRWRLEEAPPEHCVGSTRFSRARAGGGGCGRVKRQEELYGGVPRDPPGFVVPHKHTCRTPLTKADPSHKPTRAQPGPDAKRTGEREATMPGAPTRGA
nr:proline-rich protein 2-like [Dasypus novemcinctus]